MAVSRKAPKGFDEYRSPPEEWPQEGSELVADARKVLGGNNKIWLARRAPETSDYFRIRTPAVEMLKRIGVTGKAVLIDVAPDETLAKSVRNIAGIAFVASARLTARDVVDAHRVVATRGAIEKLQEVLS